MRYIISCKTTKIRLIFSFLLLFIISKVVYYIQSLSARCKCSNSIGMQAKEGYGAPCRLIQWESFSTWKLLHPALSTQMGEQSSLWERRGKIGSKLQHHSSSDVMKQDRSRRNIRKSEVSRSTAKYSLASSRFGKRPLKASFDRIVSVPPDLFVSHHPKVWD